MKRDCEALEKRRFQAVNLLEKGDLNQSEVTRRLRVCRQTVSRWADEFRNGGREALEKSGRAGRKSELSEAERIGNSYRKCYCKVQRGWVMRPRFGPVRGWRT